MACTIWIVLTVLLFLVVIGLTIWLIIELLRKKGCVLGDPNFCDSRTSICCSQSDGCGTGNGNGGVTVCAAPCSVTLDFTMNFTIYGFPPNIQSQPISSFVSQQETLLISTSPAVVSPNTVSIICPTMTGPSFGVFATLNAHVPTGCMTTTWQFKQGVTTGTYNLFNTALQQYIFVDTTQSSPTFGPGYSNITLVSTNPTDLYVTYNSSLGNYNIITTDNFYMTVVNLPTVNNANSSYVAFHSINSSFPGVNTSINFVTGIPQIMMTDIVYSNGVSDYWLITPQS